MARYRLRSIRKDRDIALTLLVYGLPGLLLMAIFQLMPIITAFFYSFFNVNLMRGTMKFIGLRNFIDAFTDPEFLNSMWVTFKYFVMRVPLQMLCGFLLALMIFRDHSWNPIMRTIILVPVVSSMVAVTSIFSLMMHPTNGLLNALLGMFGIPPQGFLTDPGQALWAIDFITVWKNSGQTMLFFLAGMMTISQDIYEAADIDGASPLQKLFRITIPLLKATFAFVFLTTTIHAFQVFGPILLTTGGGPSGATKVVVMYIYDNAFTYNQVGYASTLSILLAMLLIMISLIQRKVKGGEE